MHTGEPDKMMVVFDKKKVKKKKKRSNLGREKKN